MMMAAVMSLFGKNFVRFVAYPAYGVLALGTLITINRWSRSSARRSLP